MEKLAIVISDGVGYRNFVLTGFIKLAESHFKEVSIMSFLPKKAYDGFISKSEVIEVEAINESFPAWFFMKLKEVAHLRQHRKGNIGISINYNRNKPKGWSLRNIAKRLIYAITSICHSEYCINRFNRLQVQTFRNSPVTKGYIKLLKRIEPDFVFFTHQRPPFISPLIYSCDHLGIKTGTFIFSWDNLASKGRMAGDFDAYFVWSELMESELLAFYSEVKPEQIHNVGTSQFYFYSDPNYGLGKEQLRDAFQLEANKPFILFTCNDQNSRNDVLYVETLARFISENKLPIEVDLIVRLSPVDVSGRFEYLKTKYPFVKWNIPHWVQLRENHSEPWSQRVPTLEDINTFKSLLEDCLLCINVLSTTTLDAFLFNKPVINPVFGNAENDLFDDQKFLGYAHLQNLVKSDSSYIVKNETEYLDALNLVLNDLDKKENERNNFKNLQLGVPIEDSLIVLLESLKSIKS